ncbi:DUF4432 family protein [Horticoccus sp. 23ND18S-11]|uniref:DUF4432 family protein n=1 Tax=Horticoccus sp. 23ND18S-11 TaxID=3391832 RepID=UPI0039C9809D
MPRRVQPKSGPAFDLNKFENVQQLGGIRTGVLDAPGGGVRVALVDTGAGLRFTVALDRGGDIVDASYNDVGLAFLSPNGLRPPNPSYQQGAEWLRGWAGGLVTTCGPEYMGGPRGEPGGPTSLHGRYSSSPAVVETIRNPDPRRGRLKMEIALIVRDTRMFGPAFEIRRTLRCTLGRPEITIEDEVTNVGDTVSAHHWLYHCNFGYPFLDQGVRFIYRGPAQYWTMPVPEGQGIIQPLSSAALNRLKRVPAALAAHAGAGERGVIVGVEPQTDGLCRVGLINARRRLGVELTYSPQSLPRLAHWQHFGPMGSYATALEPFHGSLLGRARDPHPLAETVLAPGKSRNYSLQLRVLYTANALRDLVACDGPLRPSG